MNFYTKINIPSSPVQISYKDRLMLIGSCFAESMGDRLGKSKFCVDVNPFGVLYNPASVALLINRLADFKPFKETDLFANEGWYHSFYHHSSFSALSADECLSNINERYCRSAEAFGQINRMLITWGTANVYRLKKTGQIVANCHKLPEREFERCRMSVESIVSEWSQLIETMQNSHPSLKWIFTVSPIRHLRDGAHENQLSKATLLLAIQQLQERFPNGVAYFPAYELVMDELRDYRFYAEDMCHPSTQTIQYIWERFVACCMDGQTRDSLNEIDEVQKALNHRPMNPQGDAYRQFMMQTLLKIDRLSQKMPYLCFDNEKKQCKTTNQ